MEWKRKRKEWKRKVHEPVVGRTKYLKNFTETEKPFWKEVNDLQRVQKRVLKTVLCTS